MGGLAHQEVDATPTGSPPESSPGRESLGATYLPHALIFFSSACVMIVELVAGRMIARHLGSSLYTWTSIIGVVLAGISVGNLVGGWLADRRAPRSYLGLLFMAASVSCLLALSLNALFAGSPLLPRSSWPLRVFVTVVTIFFLPAVVLGTISPATAKMALERSRSLGRAIGSIYAWGAAGSIVGTLATGFWLVALLGVQGVVLVTASLLALVGLALGPQRAAQLLWLAVLLALGVAAHLPSARAAQVAVAFGVKEESSAFLFSADSHYQRVKVYKQKVADRDRPGKFRQLRVLALDHLVHGYVDLHDPTYLHYQYERVYRDVARAFVGDRRRVSAFFIGGGSYTFPRLLQRLWPGSRIDVAEIDALVVEANHRVLGLPRDTTIRTVTLDARNAVADLPAGRRYDLVFGDAFNDLSIPAHLITLEFTRQVAAHLEPHGAYLVNVIDDFAAGLLLCSFVETMQRVFPYVYVLATNRWGAGSGRETFVVAGSRVALPDAGAWAPGHQTGHEGSVLSALERKALASRCGGRVLTDADAPVENLLAPVVQRRK